MTTDDPVERVRKRHRIEPVLFGGFLVAVIINDDADPKTVPVFATATRESAEAFLDGVCAAHSGSAT